MPSRFLQDIPDDVLASAALDRPPGSRADVHSLNPSRPSRNEDAVIGGDWSTARRESRTRLGDSGDGATGAATRGRLRGNIDEKLTEWTASHSVRPSEPERIPLGVGEIVRHPVFGEGVVQEVQGSGDEEQASINFANGIGLKRLLVSIAPLQRG